MNNTGFKYAELTEAAADFVEYLPTPLAAGEGWFVTSTPITYYVEPDATPGMTVLGTAPDNAYGTIVGYLVAIP